jgi:hypothetical protein
MAHPSESAAGDPLPATFYVGLVLSWAASLALMIFFVIWSANLLIIFGAIAAHVVSLVAALEMARRGKKRLAFVIAYSPTLLLLGGAFVAGTLAGGFPTWHFKWW